MMNNIKKIISIVALSFLCMLSISPISAQEGDVTVSLPLTAEDRFVYTLDVEGGGTIYDGDMPVRNGVMKYQMSVGEKKPLKVVADGGYQVTTLTLNGQAVGLSNGMITLSGVSQASTMVIRFTPIGGSNSNNGSNGNNGNANNKVNTSNDGTSTEATLTSEKKKKAKSKKLSSSSKKNYAKGSTKFGSKSLVSKKNKAESTFGNFGRFISENLTTKSTAISFLVIIIIALCIYVIYKRRKGDAHDKK